MNNSKDQFIRVFVCLLLLPLFLSLHIQYLYLVSLGFFHVCKLYFYHSHSLLNSHIIIPLLLTQSYFPVLFTLPCVFLVSQSVTLQFPIRTQMRDCLGEYGHLLATTLLKSPAPGKML